MVVNVYRCTMENIVWNRVCVWEGFKAKPREIGYYKGILRIYERYSSVGSKPKYSSVYKR